MADIKNDTTLTTSLVSVWCEDSDVTVDLHGSNTMTNNNTVTTDTGKQGTASQFTAANSEYLSIADNASVSITGDLTIGMWVYLDSAITGWQPFIAKDSGQPNRSYAFALREVIGDNYEVFMSTDGNNDCSNNYRVATGITFSTATWYHIVMSYDSSAGTVACYRDGVLDATITSTSTGLFDSAADFQLGGYTGNSVYMDGRLNQVCLWSKLITADEVTDLYNSGTGIPYEAAAGGGSTPVPTLTMLNVG